MPRASSLVPDADDPAADLTWAISARDTFDRESPTSAELTGRGVIPGLMELWAKFLFETVQLSQRHHGDGVRTQEASRGFTEFWLQFDGQGADHIDGDFACAGRIRHWIYGATRHTMRRAIDEADQELLRTIALAHARVRVAHGRDAGTTILACATDDDRDGFTMRLAGL